MDLQTTNLGSWTADKIVSDAKQISDFIETNYVKRDDNDSISVAGNIIVGQRNVSFGENCSMFGSDLSAITDNCFVIGSENVAGTNGFKMDSFDFEQNLIVISGDIAELSDLENTIGMKYSFQITKPSGMIRINHGTVLDVIDGNKLSVDTLPLDKQLEPDSYRDLWFVDNPRFGTEPYGDSGFAEGYSNKALGYGSHAEGYNNIAGSKYSHVEGRDNIAGFCAHAEGLNCIAAGNRSHADGFKAYALNLKDTGPANASGVEVSAIGNYTRASGFRTLVSADNAFGWNGDVSRTIDDPYVVSSDGAFAINPKNGISGFYIGNETLNEIINKNTGIDQIRRLINEKTYVPGIYATGTYVIDRETIKYSEDPNSPCLIISTYTDPAITKISSKTLKSIEDGTYISAKQLSGFAIKAKIKDLYLPEVKYIGTANFYDCESLTSIYAPKLEAIKDRVFTKCVLLLSLTCYNLSSIGLVPFDLCISLSSIIVDNDKWESRHNGLIVVDKTTTPESIVLLVPNVSAFEDEKEYDLKPRICYGAVGISLQNLETFILPNVNSFLGSEPFANCKKLSYVNISNVKSIIGLLHFISCNMLQTIDFSDRSDHTTVPTLRYSSSFTTIGNDTYKIVVPDDMVEMWKAAPRWSDVAEHIFGKSEI